MTEKLQLNYFQTALTFLFCYKKNLLNENLLSAARALRAHMPEEPDDCRHNFVSYVPSVFTCLTCAHFLCALRVFIFTCLRRMHFRKCFQFLTCLRCLHQFHEMWYNPEPTAKAEMSKKSYFVFQNLDRFDFKLVLRKQPL